MTEYKNNPAEAEPYLAIARRGKDAWNAWQNGQLNETNLPDRNKIINFNGVDFSHPENKIDFSSYLFNSTVMFISAKFSDIISFSQATFSGVANFKHGTFQDIANFSKAKFNSKAIFCFAQFKSAVIFKDAQFSSTSRFSNVVFNDSVNFENSIHSSELDFTRSCFNGKVFLNFNNNTAEEYKRKFNEINFSGAEFYCCVYFNNRIFTKQVNFAFSRFLTPPEFAGSIGHEYFDVYGMEVDFAGEFAGGAWLQSGWTNDTEIATRIRRMRKIMADIHAQDVERNLFILERQAERLPLLKSNKPKGIVVITLMAFYSTFSNYGRSIVLPFIWLIIQFIGFGWSYASLLPGKDSNDIFSYTLSHALPFVGGLNPTRSKLFERLFGYNLEVPRDIELLTILQSCLGVLMLFLALQALRNLFKVK
jgi:hypothetical protein